MSDRHDTNTGKRGERCPRCDSDQVIPICYGYPSQSMLEKASRGEITLGGCVVMPGLPKRHCRACGHEW